MENITYENFSDFIVIGSFFGAIIFAYIFVHMVRWILEIPRIIGLLEEVNDNLKKNHGGNKDQI